MAGKRCQRIGMSGYARMLRCVIDRPLSREELMERCNLGRTAAAALLHGMHRLRLIHIASWVHPRRAAAYSPVYAYGERPDAPYPERMPSGVPAARYKQWTQRAQPELLAFAHILRELSVPQTIQDLHELTGVTEWIARRLMAAMRELRLVRIGAWSHRNHGGLPVPHYELALDGTDARKPSRQPKRDINRRYRVARRDKDQTLEVIHALAGNASTYQAAASP